MTTFPLSTFKTNISFFLYPDLSYLFYELFGSLIDGPFSVIKTYGLLLNVAFLFGGYVLFLELRRAQQAGWLATAHQRDASQLVLPLVLIAAFAGILGARTLSVLEDPKAFLADPIRVFFSTGGLTFYGGFIAAAGAVLWYLRRQKIPVLRFLDAAAPAVFLGYGIGRLGCHFSGDGDWGIVNTAPKPNFLPDWLWSYSYPHNVIQKGTLIPDCAAKYCHVLTQGVYPTSVYEFFVALFFFLFLWAIRKRIHRAGVLFSIFLLLNGTARFLIEFIRVNDRYRFLGLELSLSQFIALGLISIGVVFWVRSASKGLMPNSMQ